MRHHRRMANDGGHMLAMKKSPVSVAVVALTALILLTACSQPPPATVKLRIGILVAQDDLQYWVMKEQGFEKQSGLQLEEVRFNAGGPMLDAMASGSLDVGYPGFPAVLSAAGRGVIPRDVVAVGVNNVFDRDHPGNGVLVGAGITRWKDLEGKAIASLGAGTFNTAALRLRLKQEGVRSYTLVEIPFPNMGLAVAGGNVAAASMSDPYLTQSLLRGDGRLLGWIIGQAPFEQTVFTLIVARAERLRSDRGAVKAFLRAHLRAADWINREPARAKSLLAARIGLPQEVVGKMILRRWPRDGRADAVFFESIQPALMEAGVLKAPIPASQFLDDTLLNEVLAERR